MVFNSSSWLLLVSELRSVDAFKLMIERSNSDKLCFVFCGGDCDGEGEGEGKGEAEGDCDGEGKGKMKVRVGVRMRIRVSVEVSVREG